MEYNYVLIKSKGKPQLSVWVKDRQSQKWHCWGKVHSANDYPDLLNNINSGKVFNPMYKDCRDYVDIKYLPLEVPEG